MTLEFTFDIPTLNNEVEAVHIDGAPLTLGTWCSNGGGCTSLSVSAAGALSAGIHHVELLFANRADAERLGGVFKTRFRVAHASAAASSTPPSTRWTVWSARRSST